MTRSSAAAAAALLKRSSVKRITKGSTCITLGITKESIKCTGCKNVEQKYLKSRLKSASINSREYKCTQPWVQIGKTDQLIQVYKNTWKELVVDQLGYLILNLNSMMNRKPPGRCLRARMTPDARSGRN